MEIKTKHIAIAALLITGAFFLLRKKKAGASSDESSGGGGGGGGMESGKYTPLVNQTYPPAPIFIFNKTTGGRPAGTVPTVLQSGTNATSGSTPTLGGGSSAPVPITTVVSGKGADGTYNADGRDSGKFY